MLLKKRIKQEEFNKKFNGTESSVVNILKKFKPLKTQWDEISKITLSETFIRTYQHKLNWTMISCFQNLSENFIREFEHKLNWFLISTHQNLSENFLSEFSERVYWNTI